MEANKLSACILVSEELLMDCSVTGDIRPRKPPTRRQQLRWKIEHLRERMGRRVFRVIADYEVPDGWDE